MVELKIESLSEGWWDRDHLLLHACFQVLSDFVEKEMKPQHYPDWNASPETRQARKEMEDLYSWWQERKNDAVMARGKSFQEEEASYRKDNEMLKRLIDVRMHMWT
jgi:hypothetical protein